MADIHQTETLQQPASALSEFERRQRAVRHVAAIKGFYVHLAVFVVVMAGLVLIDALTDSGWWVQWVFLGWGIGVIAHAVAVFGRSPKIVADWEDRKIKQFMNER